MKRGPSKGSAILEMDPVMNRYRYLTDLIRSYIKELADRLNTLENSMIPSPLGDASHGSQMEPGHPSPRASVEHSPLSSHAPWASRQARKRTHSGTNEPPSVYPQSLPQRASSAAWSAHDAPRHLPHPLSTTPSGGDSTSYNPQYRTQFSPGTGQSQSLWTHGASDPRRRVGSNSPYESAEARPSSQDQNTAILDWHEPTVDE